MTRPGDEEVIVNLSTNDPRLKVVRADEAREGEDGDWFVIAFSTSTRSTRDDGLWTVRVKADQTIRVVPGR